MCELSAFLRQRFVVILTRDFRIEREVELIFPAKFKTCFRKRVIPILGAGMTLGQIGSVRGDLVSDYALLDVLLIWQAEMFLRRDITKHRRAVPANHRRADSGGDVIVAGRNVGRQWAKRVERSFLTSLELLVHVLLDQVHGNMTRPFDHHLAVIIPGDFR